LLNMEKEFNEDNTRNAYRSVKRLRHGYKPHTALCSNVSGGIISDREELKTTCRNYFKSLLNRETNNENGSIVVNQQQEESPVDPPTINKVQNAIRVLRNGKAPGINNIPSELLKLYSRNLLKAIEYVRIQRLQWGRHMARMGEERIPKKVINRRMQGARPRVRWEEPVDKDSKEILKCKSWRRKAKDREGWRQALKEDQGPTEAVEPQKREST
ncbi:hypothetical protein ILUMI_20171, partial [Ignelater luminosus]